MSRSKREHRGRIERRGSDLMTPVRVRGGAPSGRRLLLDQPAGQRRAAGYAMAILGTAALAGSFLPFRDSLTPLSEGFAFLVLVVVTTWIGGLGPGIVASVLAFVTFNFFFLPPYNSFVIERPEHVVVLFVLLGISVLIAGLVGRTSERALAAESRERELRALQELSGELVGRVPGNEAYESVLLRLSSLLGFDAVALVVQDDDSARGMREEVRLGEDLGSLATTTTSPGEGRHVERLPLSVGRHNLGMLLLGSARGPITPGESRVLRAFCDQLALVLERDRLLRVAAKAESYRATEKLRRALLTAVSHDLRSPLSAIKASVTDLLDEGAPNDPAYRSEALTSIDKEVDRLNLLIANLLDMSRIESGMLRARPQGVDLEEVVAQGVDQARRRWPAAHFNVSGPVNGAVVHADPVFLDRVITNLLDNAARAGLEAGNGDVELEARQEADGQTVVRISDHGKGVPNAMREHLFHPFYDLDERGARLGAGLGLAICKGFLSSMQGNIWIEQTPGGGATLAFSLESEKAS